AGRYRRRGRPRAARRPLPGPEWASSEGVPVDLEAGARRVDALRRLQRLAGARREGRMEGADVEHVAPDLRAVARARDGDGVLDGRGAGEGVLRAGGGGDEGKRGARGRDEGQDLHVSVSLSPVRSPVAIAAGRRRSGGKASAGQPARTR